MKLLKNDPKEIIKRYARSEFKDKSIIGESYLDLEKTIISFLGKKKKSLLETKHQTEQRIQYIQLHNFENFIAIRLGLYAYILTLIAIVFSNDILMENFNIDPQKLMMGLLIFGLVITTTLGSVSNRQKEETIYLKFKLACVNKKLEKE